MAKKLYVGNLPYTTTEQELRDMFSQVGEIADLAVITDRYTGQSKGFAFVEMASDDAAQEAISRFDGQMLGNRAMVVNEARPREDRGDRRGGGGGRDRY
ncbi:MAG TPA: RNA-binding protein [Chloroflexia bacterium]|nr:RNA-binding protein [Chloroflexia bacterium]